MKNWQKIVFDYLIIKYKHFSYFSVIFYFLFVLFI